MNQHSMEEEEDEKKDKEEKAEEEEKEKMKEKLPLLLVGTKFQVSVVHSTISTIWFLSRTFKILFTHNIFDSWSVQQQSRGDMVFKVTITHAKVCRLKKFLLPD